MWWCKKSWCRLLWACCCCYCYCYCYCCCCVFVCLYCIFAVDVFVVMCLLFWRVVVDFGFALVVLKWEWKYIIWWFLLGFHFSVFFFIGRSDYNRLAWGKLSWWFWRCVSNSLTWHVKVKPCHCSVIWIFQSCSLS